MPPSQDWRHYKIVIPFICNNYLSKINSVDNFYYVEIIYNIWNKGQHSIARCQCVFVFDSNRFYRINFNLKQTADLIYNKTGFSSVDYLILVCDWLWSVKSNLNLTVEAELTLLSKLSIPMVVDSKLKQNFVLFKKFIKSGIRFLNLIHKTKMLSPPKICLYYVNSRFFLISLSHSVSFNTSVCCTLYQKATHCVKIHNIVFVYVTL